MDILCRIKTLALKSSKKAKELQKIQEELKLRAPPTPPPTKVMLDQSVNLFIPPQPQRPPTPPLITPTYEDTPPITREVTPRPATPLEQTLLDLLSEKDLGATGFVTANEMTAVLGELAARKGQSSVSVLLTRYVEP